MAKRILMIIAAILVLAQFIRPSHTELADDPSADVIAIGKPSPEVEGVLRTACYDCHSNRPRFPWYNNITPVNWWLQDHINDAREELNFSEWGTYSAKRIDKKIKEIKHEVSEGDMPLPSYTWMHADARLTDAQRKELIAFFEALPR